MQTQYYVPCYRCKKKGLEVLVPLNDRCPECKKMQKGSLGMPHFYAVCQEHDDHWQVVFAHKSLKKAKEIRDRYFLDCSVNKYAIPKKIPKSSKDRAKAFRQAAMSDAELQQK